MAIIENIFRPLVVKLIEGDQLPSSTSGRQLANQSDKVKKRRPL